MPLLRACVICGSKDHAAVVELPLRVVVCKGCGVVFTNPVLSNDDKQTFGMTLREVHRSRSAERTFESAQAHLMPRAKRVLQLLTEFLPPSAEVLEIGCGDGAVLKLLRQAGARAMGIDLDAGAAQFVTENCGTPVLVGDFEQHDFQGKSFDAVVMVHLIEHLSDPVSSLRRIRSFLRPGGIVFVETPNILRPKVSPKRVYSLAHNFHFSPRSMCVAMHEAGLTPIAVREFRRDGFQIVARTATTAELLTPPVRDTWEDVLLTTQQHGARYYGGWQFLWRKLPIFKQDYLWGIHEDRRGLSLQEWLVARDRAIGSDIVSPAA